MAEKAKSNPCKRIIVCCDGTWLNSDSSFVKESIFPCDQRGHFQAMSNVTRICRCVKRESSEGIQQIVYYQSGIGSTNDLSTRLIGGATGLGLAENIREAYGFICANWKDGDEIFLLGFSRGAFTARSISALIATIGLLKKEGLKYFYQIFKDWENQSKKDWKSPWPHEPWSKRPSPRLPEYKEKLVDLGLTNPDVPIKAVAVWDTVGSLGIPKPAWSPQTALRPYSFVNAIPAPNVEYAFQALALDEHRRQFTPTLWERPADAAMPKILKQVWFPGVHADIGGGGYEPQDISNITLAWMIAQLDPFLEFEKSCVLQENIATAETHHKLGTEMKPWGLGTVHNSDKGIYKLGGSRVRTPGNYKRIDPATLRATKSRLEHTHEAIHASVRIRLGLQGWKCKALRGFEVDGVGTRPISWLWRKSPWAEPEVCLPEDVLGEVELELLKASPEVYRSLFNVAPGEHV